jgi:hypothetical protein
MNGNEINNSTLAKKPVDHLLRGGKAVLGDPTKDVF